MCRTCRAMTLFVQTCFYKRIPTKKRVYVEKKAISNQLLLKHVPHIPTPFLMTTNMLFFFTFTIIIINYNDTNDVNFVLKTFNLFFPSQTHLFIHKRDKKVEQCDIVSCFGCLSICFVTEQPKSANMQLLSLQCA